MSGAVSWNEYTFLHLYQAIGEDVWMYRAVMFGQKGMHMTELGEIKCGSCYGVDTEDRKGCNT